MEILDDVVVKAASEISTLKKRNLAAARHIAPKNGMLVANGGH
jgi:hypothetical protein